MVLASFPPLAVVHCTPIPNTPQYTTDHGRTAKQQVSLGTSMFHRISRTVVLFRGTGEVTSRRAEELLV